MKKSEESEAAVIALCFKRPDIHRRAALELTDEHFAEEAHRKVWRAILQNEAPLDITLVAQTLAESGDLQTVGGKAKLASYRFNAANPDSYELYVRSLQHSRAHRRLLASLERAAAYVDNSTEDLPVITTKVDNIVTESIRDAGVTNEGHNLKDTLVSAFVETYKAMEAGTGLTGYRTGVNAIDDMIGGFEPGHVTTLMGEAGTGKTALALQAAVGASAQVPVGFISLEMTPADLGQRIQSCITHVPYSSIRRGTLAPQDEATLATTSDELAASRRFWVAPSEVETWSESVAWVTHMYYTHGVRVFVLDNVLSLDYEGKDEYEHITRIANGSQRLVKKLDIALINLHHTNSDEKPTLRKAHGSKAIARHSSNVLALWREEPEGTDVMLMELKGRNNGRAERMLRFYPHQQRFTDLMGPR